MKIPRCPTTVAEIQGKFKQIPVFHYSNSASGLNHIKVADISSFIKNRPNATSLKNWMLHDQLWTIQRSLMPETTPNWNGYMNLTTSAASETFSTSQVTALPFINLDPGNLSTIYSAILYAQDQSAKHGMTTTVVTFDQPLYLKAIRIVSSTPTFSNVILRLGGFHLLMSFLGTIGYIMAGSGLEEVLSLIYAENSIQHILSGHAFARAIRAHLLVSSALQKILVQKIHPINKEQKYELSCLSEKLVCDSIFEVNLNGTVVEEVYEKISNLVNQLNSNRTSKLWFQYLRQVDLIKMFIRAERLGIWSLHLETTKNMLKYFHAAGHIHTLC